MKLPGIDLTPFMPLLTRGVQALERMATALEKIDDNLVELVTENDAETRPAPEPVLPDFYGRNEYGHKVLPPEPWGTTEQTGSV